MNITKDEARVLADIVGEYKHDYARGNSGSYNTFAILERIEDKLLHQCKDKRRQGRKLCYFYRYSLL